MESSLFGGSDPVSLLGSETSYSPSGPQLVILRQKTHSEEFILRNGIQREVLVVVKNSPFNFQLGVVNRQKMNLNAMVFDASLMYDCDDLKEVDFIRQKPLDFRVTPSKNGESVDVELRIKVLTSQHEDMLFKIKIEARNPSSNQALPGMRVISGPIKVISKPEPIKKKQQQIIPPSKKRTLTDMLAETVSRIESKQEQQQRLIACLIKQQNEAAAVLKQRSEAQESIMNESSQEPEFETAFLNLIKAYSTMKSAEKVDTIGIAVESCSDSKKLSELLDFFWEEVKGSSTEMQTTPMQTSYPNSTSQTHGMDAMNVATSSSGSGCQCVECPHKLELERIDEFYKEFLYSGVNVSSSFDVPQHD